MTGAPHVCLVTSFSPHRMDAERRAAGSWQRLGFDIISLNSAAELKRLEPEFPGVRFVAATRDAASFLGKPCVFIKDMATIAADLARTAAVSDASVCGIINADIELLGDGELRGALADLARGGLAFGSRVDYTSADRTADAVYELGYDYFFFEPAFAAAIPDEPYCLGAPWWDYWLPAVALQQQLPLRRVMSRIAFHERHDAAYRHETWMMYAGLMTPHLERIGAWPPLGPQSRNAAQDIGRRTIRLAETFREHLERQAQPVTIGASQ